MQHDTERILNEFLYNMKNRDFRHPAQQLCGTRLGAIGIQVILRNQET